MNRLRLVLVICAVATAGCAAGARSGGVEPAAFGCYASTAGLLNFGDPASADTVVRSWLILDLRPAREGREQHVARFLGWHAKQPPGDEPSHQLGFWRRDGDSIRVSWHNGLHGAEMVVAAEGDSLRGGTIHSSDVLRRDSTGVLIPETYSYSVLVPRVPCEQVPAPLERRTRREEPFYGMPVIRS